MRDLMAIAIIVVCAGCTTMRPVAGRADSVRVDQIASLEKRTANPARTVTLVLALLSVGALAAAAGLHAGAGGVYH